MASSLGPYRAALAQGRRRSILLLLLLALGIFGAIAWSSYRPLDRERRFLRTLSAPGALSTDAFYGFGAGFSCGFSEQPPTPDPSPTASDTAGSPSPAPTDTAVPPLEPSPPPGFGAAEVCRMLRNDGRPIGPEFPAELLERGEISPEFLEEIRPDLLATQRVAVRQAERAFAWKRILESRIRAASALLGIVFAVLLGATLLGAEWRWGVWRSLLTHEPRRGRVLGAKFVSLWTFVAVGFVGVLAVASGVDAVMRRVTDVASTGGPSVGHLAEQAGWGLLGLLVYATMAAALASIVRTSFAGVAALALALGDFLLVQKYTWLRHYFPGQQIASLVPQLPFDRVSSGYAWFPPLAASVECTTSPGGLITECHEVLLGQPPHWRASLVLTAWILGFAILAWTSLRARDVPQ